MRMINTAPDAPFGGFPDVPADPATTGQVMQFVVNSALANPAGDPSTPAASLVLDPNPGGVPKLGASDRDPGPGPAGGGIGAAVRDHRCGHRCDHSGPELRAADV